MCCILIHKIHNLIEHIQTVKFTIIQDKDDTVIQENDFNQYN